MLKIDENNELKFVDSRNNIQSIKIIWNDNYACYICYVNKIPVLYCTTIKMCLDYFKERLMEKTNV